MTSFPLYSSGECQRKRSKIINRKVEEQQVRTWILIIDTVRTKLVLLESQSDQTDSLHLVTIMLRSKAKEEKTVEGVDGGVRDQKNTACPNHTASPTANVPMFCRSAPPYRVTKRILFILQK